MCEQSLPSFSAASSARMGRQSSVFSVSTQVLWLLCYVNLWMPLSFLLLLLFCLESKFDTSGRTVPETTNYQLEFMPDVYLSSYCQDRLLLLPLLEFLHFKMGMRLFPV